MSETVELSGTVEDLFGHRFTLKGQDGKDLIDLGPDAKDSADLKPGQSVEIKGERKPDGIKAKSIRVADGDWTELKPAGKQPGHDKDHGGDGNKPGSGEGHGISDEQVTKMLNDEGYTDHGEKTDKPKHVEVIASKDGQRHKVHVHKDGVKKAEPVA